MAKAAKIAARCCPQASAKHCRSILSMCVACISRTWRRAGGRLHCPMPWRGNIATPIGNGVCRGCFPSATAGKTRLQAMKAATPGSERGSQGSEASRATRRYQQTGWMPYLPPFLCHPSAGARARHPNHSGTDGPLRSQHHHDLDAHSQARPAGRDQPSRPSVAAHPLWISGPITTVHGEHHCAIRAATARLRPARQGWFTEGGRNWLAVHGNHPYSVGRGTCFLVITRTVQP